MSDGVKLVVDLLFAMGYSDSPHSEVCVWLLRSSVLSVVGLEFYLRDYVVSDVLGWWCS